MAVKRSYRYIYIMNNYCWIIDPSCYHNIPIYLIIRRLKGGRQTINELLNKFIKKIKKIYSHKMRNYKKNKLLFKILHIY